MQSTFDKPVPIAIIGGTGLYNLETLTPVARLNIHTPWGAPSSPITISLTASGTPIAFLARHGPHHDLLPTEVPSQANIAALKSLGVTCIIAFSAVGSLQQEIKPRDFVIPTQIIDRTKGIRPSTFFERGFVGHVGFGDPFDNELGDLIYDACKDVLEGENVIMHSRKGNERDLTLICMEGPAFSTRAESKLYKSWGGDVINMSCIPESKLAREAEIHYQMVCMSTDYDAWREDEEAVTVETVVGNLKANSANAERVAAKVLEIVEKKEWKRLEGTTAMSISTKSDGLRHHVKDKFKFLFPGRYD